MESKSGIQFWNKYVNESSSNKKAESKKKEKDDENKSNLELEKSRIKKEISSKVQKKRDKIE